MTYYYVTNMQGDVVKMVSAGGAVVANYTYDAWGRVVSATGSMAEVNPIRYRGYYYDAETALYYLQSRYYDPAVKRFVNADAFASTGQGFLGCNMFAYCGNNPINRTDSTGQLFEPLIEKVSNLIAEIKRVLTDARRRFLEEAAKTATPTEKEFAATIYAEAAGQNETTKRAVGHTMMNRVGGSWGDTIEEVISQPYQFAYGNGNYKDAMSYYDSGEWDNSIEQGAMDQCLVIAVAIYRGFDTDFTGGALYFNSFEHPDDWQHADKFTLLEIEGTEDFWFYR